MIGVPFFVFIANVAQKIPIIRYCAPRLKAVPLHLDKIMYINAKIHTYDNSSSDTAIC